MSLIDNILSHGKSYDNIYAYSYDIQTESNKDYSIERVIIDFRCYNGRWCWIKRISHNKGSIAETHYIGAIRIPRIDVVIPGNDIEFEGDVNVLFEISQEDFYFLKAYKQKNNEDFYSEPNFSVVCKTIKPWQEMVMVIDLTNNTKSNPKFGDFLLAPCTYVELAKWIELPNEHQ